MKLSTTYKTLFGDTFDLIARKQYGTEIDADKIQRANPGVTEPLVAGLLITIPTNVNAPLDKQQRVDSNNINEVAVLIENKRFRFWDKIRITRSIDTVDTIEFSSLFDADSVDFRKTFKPFTYKSLVVTVGGNPLFTGVMVGVNPVIENKSKIVAVSGYSTPGILNDCTSPSSAYPLEFNDQTLTEIVKKLVEPFGIAVISDDDVGAVFKRVASKPDKKVLSFIIELAKQRGLIVSSSQEGALIIGKSKDATTTVARFEQGFTPLLSVTPFFNPQEYYSHITGIEPLLVGTAGSQFTVNNPRLAGLTRPLTFNAPDTTDSNLKTAVEAKAGRMIGNVASYSIKVNTWRDSNDQLWIPNTTVTLLAHDAMIYNNYDFIIRSIIFEKDSKTETATLNLVIPGSFNGVLPDSLPWDD